MNLARMKDAVAPGVFQMAAILRSILVIWGVIQDAYCELPFTDLDYIVFTDAAR